ncbi:MAG: glycosyltransferase family 2 protein [Caulobacterales bacterium]
MTRLSVALCIRNESANLQECLATAKFADEIVVLLDRSTDDSVAIARAAGAKVIEGAWEIEGDRRNTAIEACAGPWVLELDADERITPALASEIRDAIQRAETDAYVIPFENHIGGRAIKYGWGAYNGTSAKAALFRKGIKIWGRERVHPTIVFSGSRGRLNAPMLHYVYADIAAIVAKLNRYSDLAAEDLADKGDAGPRGHAIRRVFSRFYKAYVARKGYKEGAIGVALGLMAGLFPLLSHLKAQEKLAARQR